MTTQEQVQVSPDEKLAEALSILAENADELKGLVELIVELKRSGVLDSLMQIINRFEELIQYLFQDPAVFRLLAIALDGSLGLMNKLDANDVIRLKELMQSLGGCMSKNVNAVSNAKPVKGLMGLWRALGDEDVQRGLGVALELVKILGKCSSGKQ
ncbi:DUF1641 domain-containing protein [Caldivirga maquilingensis]|uniref:DUF1641 domain-containing protein n=1 Tax=Caldivirga maquilingensis (strain ATCC 700844 / DSM 13496 / JCM 10307 / IC-167) TaxID=397948 RepID=A8MCW0_CALMQ|nr:DUF1641 domain-containing protein [Caldivirga maquilingensis]ABW01616.1 protein of unknown function DUF1641 [Caldivirga maquilingensis IC-167]